MKQGNRLKPTGLGKVVVAFLQGNFNQYLDYDYTSLMESRLDEIAGDFDVASVGNVTRSPLTTSAAADKPTTAAAAAAA